MENVNTENLIPTSFTADSTFNGTYAEALSNGIKLNKEPTSNNNLRETDSANANDALNVSSMTDNTLIDEMDMNSTTTSAFVTANSSQSDNSDPTDNSQLLMESSADHANDSVLTATEEDLSNNTSQLTEKADDDESSIGLKDENESQCSGEYSGSDEQSDTEDDNRDIDELYPAALKWKFRSMNPAIHLPETVTVLDTKHGSKVFLVGTAHFSTESQEDVAKTIRAVQPDIVVIELCKSRVNILSLDEATILEESKNMNFQKIKATIEQNGLMQGVLYLLLLSMSASLTKQLGMAPGGEFRRAFQEARQIPGCLVHLGDRPIHITMQRALSRLSLWQKIRIACNMLRSNPISKEEVERCKQKDLLEKMLAEMTGEFPELSRVFVKERDIFLTYSLQTSAESMPIPHCQENCPTYVVGVVGIGHVPGIKEMWGKVTDEDILEILSIPEPTLTSKIMRKTFRISILGLGAYAVYKWFPSSMVPQSLARLCNSSIAKITSLASRG